MFPNRLLGHKCDVILPKAARSALPGRHPLSSGFQDPLAFQLQLQGHKMTMICPACIFNIKRKLALVQPCFLAIGRTEPSDLWPDHPTRYCDSNQAACLWASTCRCLCGKPASLCGHLLSSQHFTCFQFLTVICNWSFVLSVHQSLCMLVLVVHQSFGLLSNQCAVQAMGLVHHTHLRPQMLVY